jgi:hypothetical protein
MLPAPNRPKRHLSLHTDAEYMQLQAYAERLKESLALLDDRHRNLMANHQALINKQRKRQGMLGVKPQDPIRYLLARRALPEDPQAR